MSSEFDIEFRAVSKYYGDVVAVENIDLQVPKGSFIALLGPSGCGKTTCLRMIGGFEQPSEGDVFINGVSMVGVPAYRRPVNMVFQSYALFPHLDVAENVSYGIDQMRPRLTSSERMRRVDEALEMVRLGSYGERKIHELSGGQQQRVALARALINKPRVLLLDEPLAALDKKLRTAMQLELQNLHRELGITFLLVTHDQEEALSMSDRVCVMNTGRIVQMASPEEIYARPANLFVSEFVGKTNLVKVAVELSGTRSAALRLANNHVIALQDASGLKSGAATLSLRPEAIRMSPSPAASMAGLAGLITHRIFLGASAEYIVTVPGIGDVMVTTEAHVSSDNQRFDVGENVILTAEPTASNIFLD